MKNMIDRFFEKSKYFIITTLVVLFLATIGYVMNIIKLLSMWSTDITVEIIIRGMGIVVGPLGAIVGYFP